MKEPMNADALYVRGLCLYYQDNIEKAQQHFQQVLRLAPDHKLAITAFKVSQVYIAVLVYYKSIFLWLAA